ncbi:MAG: hypothetical protein AB7I19_03655 [Planctomycetota bacterium]
MAFKHALESRVGDLCAAAELRHPAALARQLMLLIDGAAVHAAMHCRPAYADAARAAAKMLTDAVE